MAEALKIKISQIPLEGLILQEEIFAKELDLETEFIKFHEPIKIKAEVSRITNAVTIKLALESIIYTECSRCLSQIKINLKKSLMLNYQVNSAEQFIDIAPDIREEILLDYPIKPLCKSDCRGLCSKCGKSFNEGGCNCGTTKTKAF